MEKLRYGAPLPKSREFAILKDVKNALLLTASEQKIFNSLPDSLKEGWEASDVGTLYEETPDELSFRLRMAHIPDNEMMALLSSAHKSSNPAETFQSLDFSKLSGISLGELCFLLGVKALTAMIRTALSSAKTDENLEGIAGLAQIRSDLSSVNTPSR